MKKTKYIGVAVYESAKNKDKCFYIVTKHNGKPKYEKFGWQSEGCTAAKAYEYRMEKSRTPNYKMASTKEYTIAEVIEHYKIKIMGLSAQRDVLRYLNEIEEYFGPNNRLEEITPLHVISFIDTIKKHKNRYGKPVSAQTVMHRYAVLRQLYNYASGLGLFNGKSPLTPQTKGHIPTISNTVINYFSREEAAAFIKAVDEMKDKSTANLFKFAFYTGFRKGEIFKLEWRDIDTRKGLVILREAKSGKNEIVEIGKIPLQILSEQRLLVPDEVDLVFPSRNMTDRENVKRSFATLKKKAGIKRRFRFHDLRHNFATMLLDAGADLYTVQHLLTHKDPKTTQKYAHLRTGRMSAIVDKMSDMILPE